MKPFPDYRSKGPLTLAQRTNFLAITAAFYDFWRKRSLSLLSKEEFTLEKELEMMISWLNIKPNEQFLDVGTSTGNYARALESAGCFVTAIDISEEMLKKAKNLGGNVKYELANAEMLPYPDKTFDGIVVGATLTEFFHPKIAIDEMIRVLKPEGRIFLMYITESKTTFGKILQFLFKIIGVRFLKKEFIKEIFTKNGFILTNNLQKSVVIFDLYQKTDLLGG